ncbi:MAG: cob(I)yrinic acid a,c-diamide adenosyltransferase [Dysgonamonadaceae bacterium]
MKIYTKTGDKGKTGIHGGERVDKDDIRIEANGSLDELNSMLGIVRAFMGEEHEFQPLLFRIQTEIMIVMSQVATPSAIRSGNPNTLADDLVSICEEAIDSITARMTPSTHFVLPGGNVVSAHLQMARTFARRAERRLWTLNRQDEVPDLILRFVNRLSDLLFTMARYEMYQEGTAEERWKAFLYKRPNRK